MQPKGITVLQMGKDLNVVFYKRRKKRYGKRRWRGGERKWGFRKEEEEIERERDLAGIYWMGWTGLKGTVEFDCGGCSLLLKEKSCQQQSGREKRLLMWCDQRWGWLHLASELRRELEDRKSVG